MRKYTPLDIWFNKHRIKDSGIISFVDGLGADVKELSSILGHEVILVVKEQVRPPKQGAR